MIGWTQPWEMLMRTVLVLLASLTTAWAQPLPVPKVGSCRSGYSESGGFCAPMRRDAPAAIPTVLRRASADDEAGNGRPA
jgi:hypothetical protein